MDNFSKIEKNTLIKNATNKVEKVLDLQKKGLICRSGDFVPSVHYPPITQYPLVEEDALFEGYTLPKKSLLDIYVHLPFCKQRCIFCHYPGKLGEQMEEKERYLKALEKEMDIYMKRLGIDVIKARSILIGGGTPTYLTPDQLERFLAFFCKRIDFSMCRQFNYDVDPNTLIGEEGIERLKIMRKYGVDRLTIGVQSLNNDILKMMNRAHDAKMAIEAINNCKALGFIVNIEFIYGYPGQTIDNWIEVMEEAVTLNVDEIQIYRLKVLAYGDLQGSIIKMRQENSHAIPDFEETMKMKQIALDILNENGFNETLRRVYSKDKSIFSHYAHNQCCMLYDQIGLGLTAFSSLRDRFALNTQSFEEYYAAIEAGKLPINRGYRRDEEQQARWAIILPLKNRKLKKNYYKKVTGIDFDEIFREKVNILKEHKLVEEDDQFIWMTELGKFVADEVVEQFNSNEYKPFPTEDYNEGPLNPFENNILHKI